MRSQIVPIVIGDNDRAVAVARALQADGFDVRAIRPPTVPPGTARLRVSVNAALSDETHRSLRRCRSRPRSGRPGSAPRDLRNRHRHGRRQDRRLGGAAAPVSRHCAVSYWKPIQTGIEQDDDTAEVRRLSACGAARGAGRRSAPAASRVAPPGGEAERIARSIVESLIGIARAASRGAVDRRGRRRGAGSAQRTDHADRSIDLHARRLGAAGAVVARSGLGTINHTLLTIEALGAVRFPVAGVVMVGPPTIADEPRRRSSDTAACRSSASCRRSTPLDAGSASTMGRRVARSGEGRLTAWLEVTDKSRHADRARPRLRLASLHADADARRRRCRS